MLEFKRKLYRVEPYLEKINKGGFCTLYYDFVRYLGLSMTETVLLSTVFSFCMYGNDEFGYCYATKKTVCNLIGISASTYERAMKKLMSKGYVRRKEVFFRGQVQYVHLVNYERIAEECEKRKNASEQEGDGKPKSDKKAPKMVENKEKAYDSPQITVINSFNNQPLYTEAEPKEQQDVSEDSIALAERIELARQNVLNQLAKARERMEREGKSK